jgi:hypothetical protein
MTNWAKKGKEALAAVAPVANVPAGYGKAENAGGEPFVAFYQFNAPKKEGSKGRQIIAGQGIEGEYAGSYEGTNFQGDKEVRHKLRTPEGLVGLPVCAVINNKFQGMPEGTRYYIVYEGKLASKATGKPYHSFQFYPYTGE